jgi:hypothetical protein
MRKMSVWAQSWAYEQRLGKWRNLKGGKRSWKGDPGAKSVLAAVATFADENGYAYCGQDTLAEMTDMTERSVREHLHNLEHAYGKIRREHRRKGSGRSRGEFTSDGIWLLAPAHRLRPPRRGDESLPRSHRKTSPSARNARTGGKGFRRADGRVFRGTVKRLNRQGIHQGCRLRLGTARRPTPGWSRSNRGSSASLWARRSIVTSALTLDT